MQIGFYLDQTRCTGCYACVVACKDWHDVPAGPASWMRVQTLERGKYPNLFVAFLTLSCLHCAEPACIEVCRSNAIVKRKEDGIVVVDREKCEGKDTCEICRQVCPYEAPQFGAEENAKMQMCNLCLDRLAENKKPICVSACPMRALDAGPMDELIAKYGNLREAAGFEYATSLRPSVIFKPKVEKAVSSVSLKR
ncbi:MAG: 4Fe-4S dicluster domain-containing protein [Chloroflexi bacterium]|nr:4Fe-4S dicluster domain-containing protein [Chloroflexota bacterium]